MRTRSPSIAASHEQVSGVGSLRGAFLSRPARLVAFTIICAALFFITSFSGGSTGQAGSQASLDTSKASARLHLLVPATSSNYDLCKLLLSVQILGYPAPILINYGATEAEDPYVQHLAKVQGIANYLDLLLKRAEHSEELVLVVDGYDLWFQLPPDVLLSRYYDVIAKADIQAANTYGSRIARQKQMRHSIVFGPDKICWPIDFSRPACWAAPLGSMATKAFGPRTSSERESLNLPRWLNSGTVIGPIQDLKDLFDVTLHDIHTNYTTDSDQYYLAEVFGRQEYARLLTKPALLQQYKEMRYGQELDNTGTPLVRSPPLDTELARTEYHITIDYESAMFQTVAFWKQFVTWVRPSDSWPSDRFARSGARNPYQIKLPDDLKASRLPIAIDEAGAIDNDKRTWDNVSLLYNVITEQIPASVHFTGDKAYRDFWWKNVWFQDNAERFRRDRLQTFSQNNTLFGPINGFMWENAVPPEAEEMPNLGVGGAWSDRGGLFSWNSLCKSFEQDLYHVPNGLNFHRTVADDEAARKLEETQQQVPMR